ncbi:hypothetical protein ACP275_12G055700 [Erythranthe tilingii]
MMSQLPNDILISIISRLTVAEAVMANVLSACWRGLHKYITRLNFSPTSKKLQAFKDDEEFRHQIVGNDDRVFEQELLTSRWVGVQYYCMEEVKKFSNEHLKNVKLSGLLGGPCEIERGSYIDGKATALEELVMEICPDKNARSIRRARARVNELFRLILRD